MRKVVINTALAFLNFSWFIYTYFYLVKKIFIAIVLSPVNSFSDTKIFILHKTLHKTYPTSLEYEL